MRPLRPGFRESVGVGGGQEGELGVSGCGAEAVERRMVEHFNSMIQQRYQFPQMAGRLLLTYIGGE